MHAKTDSEVTSLAPSSPPRSPTGRRQVYYVQSPSRDSHDGEKTATSFHSTPVALSPMASPRHSLHSSVGPQSRDSSSRFSGSIKPSAAAASRKISSLDVADGRKGGRGSKKDHCDTIEEEGLLGEEEVEKGIPRKCYYLAFVLGFLVLFSFFALILWGASRYQKPKLSMKSITFENFIIQAGTDASLVPTDMATLKSTVKFTCKNTGTFFGVHVSATPLQLDYQQLNLASGDMMNFYQSRKSQRSVNVVVEGTKVPLYGGGPTLTTLPGPGNSTHVAPIHLSLGFVVKSKAYVLGELVKPKFQIGVQCSVVMDPNKLNSPVSLTRSCQYF